MRLYDEKVRYQRLAQLEARYSPLEAVRQLFLAFTSGMTDKRSNAGCFMTNTALELAAHDRATAVIVARAQRELEAFLARMVAKAQAQGEIRAEVRPDVAASGLLASLLGILVLMRSRPEPRLLHTIVDDAIRRLV